MLGIYQAVRWHTFLRTLLVRAQTRVTAACIRFPSIIPEEPDIPLELPDVFKNLRCSEVQM